MVPSLRLRAEGWGRNPPHPSPAQCWAPRPSPHLRHPAPVFRASSDRDARKSGAGWWGMRGGSGGRGLDSRARGNNLGLLMWWLLPTPTLPPSLPGIVPTIRPHIRGGGALLGGRGVGLGYRAAKPPKPLPPPVLFAAISCARRSPASSTGGGWGATGGF